MDRSVTSSAEPPPRRHKNKYLSFENFAHSESFSEIFVPLFLSISSYPSFSLSVFLFKISQNEANFKRFSKNFHLPSLAINASHYTYHDGHYSYISINFSVKRSNLLRCFIEDLEDRLIFLLITFILRVRVNICLVRISVTKILWAKIPTSLKYFKII